MTMRWRKSGTGSYSARDETSGYILYRREDITGYGRRRVYWVLEVRELIETAGLKHSVGQRVIASTTADRKSDGQKVAQAYVDLGDGYRQSEHGGKGRMTEAIQLAYEAIRDEENSDHA